MSYGVIEYNEEGLPKCEICGGHFKRVVTHVRQYHNMTGKEYKLEYGLDLIKGICSKESSLLSRERVYEHYEECIGNNLLSAGSKTRFEVGSEGRTRDKVSEQTMKRLKANLETGKMKAAMEKNGRTLGLSGLGNEARWKDHVKKTE